MSSAEVFQDLVDSYRSFVYREANLIDYLVEGEKFDDIYLTITG